MTFKRLALAFTIFAFGFGSSPMLFAGGDTQPLANILEKIGEKYQVVFSYNSKDVKRIEVQFEFKEQEEEELDLVVNRVLSNTGLKYKYLGANFFVIHKNNRAGKRKLRKIKRKIQQIERLGESSDLTISSGNDNINNILNTAEKLNTTTVIRGTISDQKGKALIGASVLLSGTNIGTATDSEGKYELKIPVNAQTLDVTYTGFIDTKVEIDGESIVNVRLNEGVSLRCVTVFGSRSKPQTSFDSAVPIDHFTPETLSTSGKLTLEEQLMFKVPSYNATQQPISDAAAHFSPADLRGLLPSRTLVLVNGKRKNSSALVYSYVTAGRGEVGVDMKSISTAAIENVEILRDGAAAQYGSDAVAGVINLVLKKQTSPFLNMNYSLTGQGDGMQFQVASGFSVNIKDRGYANFTLSYLNQRRSQRAGQITSPKAEMDYWDNDDFDLEYFEEYLERNPSAGFQVGIPDMGSINFSFNTAYTLNQSNETELYAFGTLMERIGSSPQFSRVPYWVSGFEAVYPDQDYFLPEMSPEIADQTLTAGFKTIFQNWKMDISSTFGRNRIDYHITNSFNQSLGVNSPKDFYSGSHAFIHIVNNFDAVKTFDTEHIESLTIALGAEQRMENFRIIAGEFASYVDGTPNVSDRIGSESFGGFRPKNESSNYRNNIGFYTEITSEFTKKLLLGTAIRYEKYSDFGDNVSWKLNSRLKVIEDKLNIRASFSNGFRAPALHQIYYTALTTTLTQEGVVQNRIFNNHDVALKELGIPTLTPETSFNLGGGCTYHLNEKLGFAIDLYQIKVMNRIVLSGQVEKTGNSNSPIDQLLNNAQVGSGGFFLNAVNTTTKGIDLVFNFENSSIGKGKLKGSIAANFNKTTVDEVNLPEFIEENNLNNNVLSREDISRIETWRPQQKIVSNGTYTIARFSTSLSFLYYGAVTYKHPNNIKHDATYRGKLLTDLSVSYSLQDKIKLVFGVHNLFNVYPDTFIDAYKGIPSNRNIDFVGRFRYPWKTTQFGIDGIRFFTNLNIKF